MDTDKILVSVIVPVYNVKAYLQACIDSLCTQTYKNLEIILVDDGSTDGSGSICDEAAERDDRIRVIHKENTGVSDARNAGLDHMHGEYVCFSDSDDIYAFDGIETLLKACEKTKASMTVGNYRDFLDVPDFSMSGQKCVETFSGCDVVKRLIGKEHIRYTVVHGKIYRKELFEKFRFLSGKIHEDEDFAYQVLYQAERVTIISDVVYGYRVRSESITTTAYKRPRLQVLDIARRRVEFFEKHSETYLAQNFKWIYAMLLLQHYPRVKKDLKDPELAKMIKKEFRKTVPELLKAPELSGKRKLMTAAFSVIPDGYAPFMQIKEKSIKSVRNRGKNR